MSISLMSVVWKLDLPTTDKMVLLALADAANDDGVTWMAVKSRTDKLDLLTKCSLSERAIQGALKRLEAGGYLDRKDRPGKGVIWTVKPTPAANAPRTNCAPQQMPPAADDVDPRSRCGETVNNHQLEAKASLSPAKPTTYPEPFESAWKAYPHIKGRSSKPKALGYWRRLSPATRQALPSAIARYAREGREPKADCGAPAMQRWLSEARYEDWLSPATTGDTERDDDWWSRKIAMHREEALWWPELGPPPGQPGCRVPRHLLISPANPLPRQGHAA